MDDFKFPIRLRFNPLEDSATREVFQNETARNLYLLWRVGHIVPEEFPHYVLPVARRIEAVQPKVASELLACFPLSPPLHPYWNPSEVREFCQKALPYLIGETPVHFEILPPVWAYP